MREKLEKVEAESRGEVAKLSAVVAKEEETTKKLKDFVKQQDKQCDELAVSFSSLFTLFQNQVEFLSKELDSFKEKCSKKTAELAEMRQKLSGADVQEVEMRRLKDELGRAKDKIVFMEVGFPHAGNTAF